MYSDDKMFFNKFNHIQLHEEIYVLKNFLLDNESEKILNILNNVDEKDWYGDKNQMQYLLQKNQHKYGITDIFRELNIKYYKMFDGKYVIHGPGSIARISKNGYCEIHSDNPNPNHIDYEWPWTTVLYINNFEGGEIQYPHLGLSYKPKKNDVIFHRPNDNFLHQVSKVESEKRYAISAWIRTNKWVNN